MNVFKQSTLILTVLSCVAGINAAEDDRKSTASSFAMALANGVMAAGTVGIVLSNIMMEVHMNPAEFRSIFPPSMSEPFLSTDPILCIIPSLALTAGAVVYSFKSAKSWSKIRSVIGSSITIAGGLCLAEGFMELMVANTISTRSPQDTLWYTKTNTIPIAQSKIANMLESSTINVISGTGLSLLGYAIQPTDKS